MSIFESIARPDMWLGRKLFCHCCMAFLWSWQKFKYKDTSYKCKSYKYKCTQKYKTHQAAGLEMLACDSAYKLFCNWNTFPGKITQIGMQRQIVQIQIEMHRPRLSLHVTGRWPFLRRKYISWKCTQIQIQIDTNSNAKCTQIQMQIIQIHLDRNVAPACIYMWLGENLFLGAKCIFLENSTNKSWLLFCGNFLIFRMIFKSRFSQKCNG